MEAPRFNVSRFRQTGKEYGLNIEVEDRHVGLTTYPWTHRKGSYTCLSIFDLTPEDMEDLGERILREAQKVKEEGGNK